ncbi:MAG TPA: hypothetical protein VMA31_14035, partial [Bryobacteraceae bacterium]|nr:hypothetical protein [Bryobacteraceae bacterium]
MDASHKLSKTALILTAALSLAANAFGVTGISVSPSNPVSINSSSVTYVYVSGGSGSYSYNGVSGTPSGWFSVSGPIAANGQTFFDVIISNPAVCNTSQVCTGSFSVFDQQNTADSVTVNVTSAAGSGGTGGTNGGFSVSTTSVVIAPGGSTFVTLSN